MDVVRLFARWTLVDMHTSFKNLIHWRFMLWMFAGMIWGSMFDKWHNQRGNK